MYSEAGHGVEMRILREQPVKGWWPNRNELDRGSGEPKVPREERNLCRRGVQG